MYQILATKDQSEARRIDKHWQRRIVLPCPEGRWLQIARRVEQAWSDAKSIRVWVVSLKSTRFYLKFVIQAEYSKERQWRVCPVLPAQYNIWDWHVTFIVIKWAHSVISFIWRLLCLCSIACYVRSKGEVIPTPEPESEPDFQPSQTPIPTPTHFIWNHWNRFHGRN